MSVHLSTPGPAAYDALPAYLSTQASEGTPFLGGGGVQHGEWNERAKTLRNDGYAVANVFASLSPEPLLGTNADLGLLDQLLMERFLIRVDDGWIFRGARSYRGALQAEDEEAGAKALVLAMLDDPTWLAPARFARLRESVRLLPLPRGDEASAARVRALALELAEKDKAFTPLRAKIHNVPDAGDAAKVRDYARRKAPRNMRSKYEALASDIDKLYASGGAAATLEQAAGKVSDPALSAALIASQPVRSSASTCASSREPGPSRSASFESALSWSAPPRWSSSPQPAAWSRLSRH